MRARRFSGRPRDFFPESRPDIGGTLNLLHQVDLARYDLGCKLHTKMRPLDRSTGAAWRRDLLRACLERPDDIFDTMQRQPEIAMMGSQRWLVDHQGGQREDWLALCDRVGLERRWFCGTFVAGTMFWCRPAVMQRLKDSGLRQDEFEEGYANDGTLAHGVERLFGAIARSQGTLYGRRLD